MTKDMLKILITILFMLTPSVIMAQKVSSELAKQKAYTFLNNANYSVNGTRNSKNQSSELVLANHCDEYYVFNDIANGGYVVVSGDERMPDVLAFTYDDIYDEESIPCNMQEWLNGYADQIAYLRAHPEAKVLRSRAVKRENIPALMRCWFDQGKYYNDKCPTGPFGQSLTGCVATAMAQIMYYYQWPKQTLDEIPAYTTDTHGIKMPAIPVTEIDWSNILDIYYSSKKYTEAQVDAISTLMLLCGSSAKMDYGKDKNNASSASLVDAMSALETYFSYSDEMEYIGRDKYEIETWEQMVYNELLNKRPLLYDGYNDVSTTGHAFVIDGYLDGYFHVNWGWGNKYAYVAMTDVDGWEGYTEHQGAIFAISPVSQDAPKRYAVFDENTMTFYYDNQQSERKGTVLPKLEGMKEYSHQVKKCIIDPSFAGYKINSLYGFFEGWELLESVEGLRYLNTTKVKDMRYMFYNCRSLASLDLSGFNTENVTNMSGMFSTTPLASLDLSSFKTDKVTDMSYMFYYCPYLTTLDITSFKTDNVKDMSYMFFYCPLLSNLDVGGFRTDNVSNMYGMFYLCSSLKNLDVSGFKTDNVTNMAGLFAGCESLTNLDVSGFKTDNVTDMRSLFAGCSGLTILNVSSFKTDNVTNMAAMFSNCSSVTNLNVSGFKTDKVTDMGNMFGYCRVLTSIDLSGFKTDKVTNMSNMFTGCNELTTIYASDLWNTSIVEKSENMFSSCLKLVGGKGTTYDQNHCDVEYACIDGGTEKPGYFTYKDSPTDGIHSISVDMQNNKWYTLDGRRLDGAPTRQGIYICNGRKVFVK